MRSARVAFLSLLCAAVGCGCARSSLRIFEMDDGSGGTAGTGGTGGTGLTGGTGGTGLTGGTGPGGSEPFDCVLGEPVEPVEVIAEANRDAHTPSLVVTDSGDATAGWPSAVVVQAVVSTSNGAPNEIMALPIRFDPVAYPGGMGIFQSPTPVVTNTWSYAQMALHRSEPRLALTWNAASQGIQFRTTDEWAGNLGTVAQISATNTTPLGLAAGPAAGFGGGYQGDGFGIVWEEPTDDVIVAAVLDDQGTVALGPHSILGETAGTDASHPAITWTGEDYILATGVISCAAVDPLCRTRSVVISRFRPASGDAWDDSGIDFVTSFELLETSARVSHPSLATWQGETAVAWMEGDADDDTPRTVRIAPLRPDGQPRGMPRIVSTTAMPTAPLRLSASHLGVVVLWAEDGDTSLAEDALGYSHAVGHRLDFALQPDGAPFFVDTTRFESWSIPPAVGIEYPDALVMTWSARSQTSDHSAAFVSRIECERP